MDEVKVIVKYKNNSYEFNSGYEAFIFHTGIYNDVDKKFGISELLSYTELVSACYIKDSNPTPLGQLGDYIAQHYKRLKNKDRYYILDKFYTESY